jgi:hypothetical protein
MDAEKMLVTAYDLCFQVVFTQIFVDNLFYGFYVFFPVLLVLVHPLRISSYASLFRKAKGPVFQFVFYPIDAQSRSDGSVDVQRFLCDFFLFRFAFVKLERPHVVEPVGQLDQNHPNVVCHGQSILRILSASLA